MDLENCLLSFFYLNELFFVILLIALLYLCILIGKSTKGNPGVLCSSENDVMGFISLPSDVSKAPLADLQWTRVILLTVLFYFCLLKGKDTQENPVDRNK